MAVRGEGRRTVRGWWRWALPALVVASLGGLGSPPDVEASPAAAPSGVAPVQGRTCLASTSAADLSRLFDTEPGGVVGADYQRPFPLPDGRVLWLFQDAAVRMGADEITIVHSIAMLQEGRCFDVLYHGAPGSPLPFLFPAATVQYERWFWPLDAELGTDGRLHLFVVEMVERGDRYLTRVEPQGTWVAIFDPALDAITWEGRPADASDRLYGWSIASDEDWTYLYGQCYRQFGYDLHIFTPAFDGSCSRRVTVARVPRGELLDAPQYWDGARWQDDPLRAVSVVDESNRLINAVQVEWNGSSFFSINKLDDWWGDRIELARAASATGPFVVADVLAAVPKCPECNTFFATWVPRAAAPDRPPSTFVYALSHNRWDGVVTSLYRPTFHEVPAPAWLGEGRTLRVALPPEVVGSSGVVANVTAVAPSGGGFVSVWPCDRPRPEVSSLNYVRGGVVANAVVVRPSVVAGGAAAGGGGEVCVFSLAATDVVVDLVGGWGSGFVALDAPRRIVDTRAGVGTSGSPG